MKYDNEGIRVFRGMFFGLAIEAVLAVGWITGSALWRALWM